MEERSGIVTMKGNPLTLLGKVLRVGDPAPDFEAPDQDGNPVRLADFKGRRLLVFFYPKANTSG